MLSKIYTIQNDCIIVNDLSDFNIEHILECGQIFSYKKAKDGYEVYSLDKLAKVIVQKDCCKIYTQNIEYFINFFDLDSNYTDVKTRLLTNANLQKPIQFGYGIRILKQDIYETIISFVISANNNIKRIQKILFAIREKYGKKINNFYSFPAIDVFAQITEQEFKSLGAGYRASYLVKLAKQLQTIDLSAWQNLSTENLRKELQKLSGVGPKVADCILLFGFGRKDVFPVDTWIENVYNTYFSSKNETNRIKINKALLEIFKDLSGYAQQYLFYYQRSNIE